MSIFFAIIFQSKLCSALPPQLIMFPILNGGIELFSLCGSSFELFANRNLKLVIFDPFLKLFIHIFHLFLLNL